VLAVVGAAHVPGVESRLDEDIDTALLELIPPPPGRTRTLRSIFPLFAIALVTALALGRVTPDAALAIAIRLVAPAASLAAVLAIVAGANPVTALLCVPLAPLTLVVPLVRFDHAVGTVEARLRPMTPADGLRARDDMLAPASARKSRFLRPLLAAVLGSFGRTIGAVIGLVWALFHAL
jgi:pheromone shutdown protein TraB